MLIEKVRCYRVVLKSGEVFETNYRNVADALLAGNEGVIDVAEQVRLTYKGQMLLMVFVSLGMVLSMIGMLWLASR